MADKMLDRISKVLHQAENAATPEEAAAFMTKAQELATANAIDLAMARAHQADKTKRQEVEERTVTIDPWAHRQSPSTKWKCDLFLAIARVNDIQCLIGGRGNKVYPAGFPGDLDVAEALYSSLAIQMISSCDEALKHGANKEVKRVYKRVRVPIPADEIAWGEYDATNDRYYDTAEGVPNDENGWISDRWNGYTCYPPPKTELKYVLDEHGNKVVEETERSIVDGRIFRANFYEGFIARVTSRLWEAKRTAEAEYKKVHGEDADDKESGSALVLRNKREEVEAYQQKRLVGVRGSYKGAETKAHSSHGQSAGRHAGANARIGGELELSGGSKKEIG